MILNQILKSRARKYYLRLAPFLPAEGRILDIGLGSGHTCDEILRSTHLAPTEADTENRSLSGRAPVLFDGQTLPFPTGEFKATLMLSTLLHCADPARLVKEAIRVTRGRVILMQRSWPIGIGCALLNGLQVMQNKVAKGFFDCSGPGNEPLPPKRLSANRTCAKSFGGRTAAWASKGGPFFHLPHFYRGRVSRKAAGQTWRACWGNVGGVKWNGVSEDNKRMIVSAQYGKHGIGLLPTSWSDCLKNSCIKKNR